MALSGAERSQRYRDRHPDRVRATTARCRSTGAPARNQRRYLASGGRHQESATKMQRKIEAMVAEHPELEAIANGR